MNHGTLKYERRRLIAKEFSPFSITFLLVLRLNFSPRERDRFSPLEELLTKKRLLYLKRIVLLPHLKIQGLQVIRSMYLLKME